MLYYFYLLYHEREVEKDNDGNVVPTQKMIAYFSTRKKADRQIAILKEFEGFCDYPIECFKIYKLGVRFQKPIVDKVGTTLYVLRHEYEDEEGYDHETLYYPVETEAEAISEMEKEKKKKKFRDHLEGFIISEWKVDIDIYWADGFFTY